MRFQSEKKLEMRGESEKWLMGYLDEEDITNGLFVTLTIPPDSISPYRKETGFIGMSNREVCIAMLRNLKNKIKKKFYGRQKLRGWFVPVIEGDGGNKNYHLHFLISIPDTDSRVKYRDELREYIENCWKLVVRRHWVSIQIDEGNNLKTRVEYICKEITDPKSELNSDCILEDLLEENNKLPV